MEQLRDLVLVIARALVDDPEQVKVNVIEGGSTFVIELYVAKKDVGKVIGKQGKTAAALRVILEAAAHGRGKRSVLEIIE
jgi:predicted RNA-binding protein YlqC (UPF0109 family)